MGYQEHGGTFDYGKITQAFTSSQGTIVVCWDIRNIQGCLTILKQTSCSRQIRI